MANKKTDKIIKPVTSENRYIFCVGEDCQKERNIERFYKNSKVDPKSDIPISYKYHNLCKDCIKKMLFPYEEDGARLSMENLLLLLQRFDMPFIQQVFDSATKNNKLFNLGIYIRQINMKKYKDLTWLDGDNFKEKIDMNTFVEETPPPPPPRNKVKTLTEDELDRLEDKWGVGYTDEEYISFDKKWDKLIDNYGQKTEIHTENLKTYIRFRVKEELATAHGDVKEAKDWGSLASVAQKDAKLNVSQLSKSDISGGVDLVCQIFEALETEISIIPILPKMVEVPFDEIDMIIWAQINYGRRLEGKPTVEYADIWKFYDEMLTEYCKQQGMDDKAIEKYKQDRNNVFRDLGQLYKEPLYEDGDY